MSTQIRQYGTWPSPVSPGMIAGRTRLYDVQWDTDGRTLVWQESSTLYSQQGTDAPLRLSENGVQVRGGVGYGGGGFTVARGMAYYVEGGSRLYRQPLAGGPARPLTPQYGRVGGMRVSGDGRWLAFVHSYEKADCLAVVDTEGKHWPRRLLEGTDFVMQPAWHPDGKRLACITWDHPRMPWLGTELRLLHLAEDAAGLPYVQSAEVLAGDANTVIFQPEFSPDGRHLSYISDASGWGQLYLYDLQEAKARQITTAAAEHGQPGWIQGMRSYSWAGDGAALFYLRNEKGFFTLRRYDIATGDDRPVDGLDAYTALDQPAVNPSDGRVALLASASHIPARVISCGGEGLRVHARSSTENVPAAALAAAQRLVWRGHDGEEVHGLYYAPAGERFRGVGAPPLLVSVHGGPTSQMTSVYNPLAQFFATRGYAVLEVNYRGSTGYGRAYMEKHAGSWGLYDVEDSRSGALHLVEQGLADRERLVIMGGSAGGFTVLQSLVDYPGFYRAGVSLYGVANQFMLVMETHKFEERYSDWLLGPLPDAAALYRERSPIFHAEQIRDPLILFQGEDDDVVPRNQSDMIADALQARGVPHEYHIYEGEGHGFRRPENIEHMYTRILAFLMQHVIYA